MRNHKIIHTLVALVAASMSQGCQAGLETDGTEMAATERRFELIEGPDVVKCWAERDTSTTDDFFRSDGLYCQRLDVSDFPLIIRGSVNAFGEGGNVSGARLADLGAEPVRLLSLRADEYPAEVQIDLLIDNGANDVTGFRPRRLVRTFEVAQPDAEPTTARVPFDLWPVQVTALEAGLSGAHLDGYQLDVAPFAQDGAPEIAIEQAWLPTLALGRQEATLIAVSRGTTELTGTARIGSQDDVAMTLTGPGRYVVDPNGLRALDDSDADTRSEGPTYTQCWLNPVVMALPEGAPEDAVPETRYQPTCARQVVEHLDVQGLSARIMATGQETATSGTIPLDGAARAMTEPLPAERFPVTIEVDASVSSSALGFREALQNEALGGEVTLTLDNVDQRVGLDLPFAFGTVTLLPDTDGGAQMFQGSLDDYVVVLGRPWAGRHSLAVTDVAFPFVMQDPVTTTFVVSSHQTELTGKAFFFDGASEVSEETDFTVQLGATYRVTFDGFVLAP